MEECLIDLLERYPCREEYFTQLYNYFGNPLEPYPPSLYIQGPSKIGKTTLLKHFLNHREIRYAYMDCVEYYTAKMLFEDIINIFAGHRISSANKFEKLRQMRHYGGFHRGTEFAGQQTTVRSNSEELRASR